MEISVVIPTYRRPAKIAACLRKLAVQTLAPTEYEVLVGLDGEDREAEVAARRAWAEVGGKEAGLRVVVGTKVGLAAVRNRLLEVARGRVMVSMNDDVLADRGFLEAHAAEHRRASREGRAVIVSGASPWILHDSDRAFDRLVRETSMVFFYDAMDTAQGLADRDRDWGFRHAWGLNFSAPMDAVRELGGFAVFPAKYGYEDNEMAFRLRMPVLYRPEARAWHDHRM
jgi:GT2 family glycosyltransferase